MKPLTSIILASLFLPTTHLIADPKTAPEQDENPPRHVRIQIEFIEMPLKTMSQLLDDPEATKTDKILRQRVNQLIDQDKATIKTSQLLIARSGEKATSESIREFIYPTEYEPPEMPQEVHTASDGTKTTRYNAELATGPTPTAFETRNLGSTIEIKPEIGTKAQYIALRFASDIVYHTKNITYATWTDKRGDANIVMPEIYTLRCNTSVTLRDKQPSLVAALSPKDKDGKVDYTRKLLIFAKAHIIHVK